MTGLSSIPAKSGLIWTGWANPEAVRVIQSAVADCLLSCGV